MVGHAGEEADDRPKTGRCLGLVLLATGLTAAVAAGVSLVIPEGRSAMAVGAVVGAILGGGLAWAFPPRPERRVVAGFAGSLASLLAFPPMFGVYREAMKALVRAWR